MELDVNKVINELKKVIADKEYENCLLKVQVEELNLKIAEYEAQQLLERK